MCRKLTRFPSDTGATMSYPTVGTTTIAGGVTAVDCQKQVRSWRLLRSLMELLIPTCNCTFIQEDHETCSHSYDSPRRSWASSATITGTIFGHRRGKFSFCIQANPKSAAAPLLLLELAIPTSVLAREMRSGVLRIALECSDNTDQVRSLLSMPVWTMYCNGRRAGFAVKRKPSKADMEVLQLMESVGVGAGTVSTSGIREVNSEDKITYLRGKFEIFRGSSDSQSFHLIDPDGNIGQELLSIFFIRSN